MGFWAVLEAPMDFTFQPPFLAGLSGYIAEMASALLGADLELPTAHLDDASRDGVLAEVRAHLLLGG